MSKWVSVNAPITYADGLKINQSYPCSTSNYATLSGRTVKYIVMHYTGNSKDTASANVRYFQGNNRNASAHYFVDEDNIYQSVGAKNRAWHCGGYSYWHKDCRNQNSIGIEMCCNGDYKMGEKTIKHAAYLCAELCKYVGIGANQVDEYVLRHYDVTGKQCPAPMAGPSNSEWEKFKNMVKVAIIGKSVADAVEKIKEVVSNKTYMPDMPKLLYGSRGTVVKNLQFILNGSGFNCGKADGVFGNATKSAVIAFQHNYSLTEDGVVGNQTWECMLEYPMRYLSVGSKGYQVKVLQMLLTGYGYKTAIDGVFGNGTKKKLIAYQKSRKIIKDGKCGPETWKKILS